MKKILFFIAGTLPTPEESAALLELSNETEIVEVNVRTASFDTQYGSNLEPCDFVAGTAVPSAYSEVPVWGEGEGSIPVSEDDVIAVKNSAVTVSINGVAKLDDSVVSVELPATVALVSNGVGLVVPVTGTYATKATPTVVNGVITGIVLG